MNEELTTKNAKLQLNKNCPCSSCASNDWSVFHIADGGNHSDQELNIFEIGLFCQSCRHKTETKWYYLNYEWDDEEKHLKNKRLAIWNLFSDWAGSTQYSKEQYAAFEKFLLEYPEEVGCDNYERFIEELENENKELLSNE